MDTDFTHREAAGELIEELAEWTLVPYPGDDISVDYYDNGLIAVYGVWNYTQFQDRGLNPGDHVRIAIDPVLSTEIHIDKIPLSWPVHADLATTDEWAKITQGEDYDKTDEVLYDLAPSSFLIWLSDFE